MPQTQNPAAGFLFILFLLWLLFPEGDYRQSIALSEVALDRLQRFRQALDVLNTTTWGDFAPGKASDKSDAAQGKHLNLTGFRQDDGFAWQDLELFREKGLKLSRHAVPPVGDQQLWDVAQGEAIWTNASGTVHGDWVRRPGSVSRTYDSYNLSRTMPAVDWIGHRTDWARNVTGESGRMMLRLHGNKSVDKYEQLPADSNNSKPLSGGIIRNVRGKATVEDTTGSGLSWEMKLWGVHWPRQGVILMTTTSEKFEGIFGLPHFSPGPDFYQSSQRLLNQTLAKIIRRKEKHIYEDQRMPFSSDAENPMYTEYPSPHCEYIMYAQVHPPLLRSTGTLSKRSEAGKDDDPVAASHAAVNTGDIIRAIESELQNPLGAPIPRIPKLRMSAVIYSPDCAFFLETKGPPEFPTGESNHLVGTKTEVHTHQIKTWLLLYSLVVFGQVKLLRDQMKESFTPSTMGRISFGTISTMLVVDGITFTAAATWVSEASATFLPTLALMFAAFLSMTIGGSFLAKIYEVQLPEGRDRSREQTTSTTPAEPQETSTMDASAGGPLLPGPVTASRFVRPTFLPVIVPSDQDVDAEIADAASAVPGLNRNNNITNNAAGTTTRPGPALPAPTFQAIVGRFILFSLCISFLAISSSTWYPTPRSVFLNLCAFAYLSLWIPQIYRNTLRNCRRALAWPFVVGQSILRLLPIAYFWIKEDNFLYATTDFRAFAALVAWVWLQVVVLVAQQVVGPRFGIPAAWTPDAWDYHPILREDNVEAGGLPIGLVVAEDRTSSDGTRSRRASSGTISEKRPDGGSGVRAIDCAICRELLEVPVIRAGEEEATVSGVFARRMYMVTPCRHIFHTNCLESWMRFRLQCPICREELPPI